MSALIRLYPAAWRERYEDEFLALLAARPPTLGDRFDVVRGAVDARIHPQVRTAGTPEPKTDRDADLLVARRLGFAALVGAALWVSTFAVAANGPIVHDGGSTYRDGGAAFPLFFVAVWLLIGGLVGQAIWLPPTARLARAGVFIAIPFLMLWSFGPWVMIGLVGAVIGLATLSIGAARAGRWPLVASLALATSVVALLALFVVAFGGLISVPPDVGGLLLFTLALPMWLAVGGSLVAGSAHAEYRPA